MFTKATKADAKLRMGLIGPAGSGKTYTALTIASGLGGRIAVLDTEHGSASKYSDIFEFDTMQPDSFSPQVYIDAIKEAQQAGYNVLVIDSLSHAWNGKGGALEMVDAAARRLKGNSYVAWKDVTPLQQAMIDAILAADMHIIATLRSKMEYVQEKEPDGRTTIKKLGMQPIQRDGTEYELDIIGDLDNENTMTVTKSRIPALSGAVIRKPGKQLAEQLLGWLAGEKREQRPVAPVVETSASTSAGTVRMEAQRPAVASTPPPAATTGTVTPGPKSAAPGAGTTSPKTNGHPRSAETVKRTLAETAAKTPAKAQGPLLDQAMTAIGILVGGNEEKRRQLTGFLFGKRSPADLTAGECLALMQWAGVRTVNNERVPMPMAVQEANAILASVAELAS